MKLKKSTLAAGIALAVGLGMAGQASAEIYAGSSLMVSDLAITFTPTIPGVDPSISNYVFNVQSSALVAGVGLESNNWTCQGSLTNATVGNCGYPGTALYSGIGTGAGAGPADVGITATGLNVQPVQTVTFYGPGGAVSDFSNADSIIDQATLVDADNGDLTPGLTSTRQITESAIVNAPNASASTTVQSTTTLTYLITIGGTGTLDITFLADPDLLSQFNDATASGATSQASTSLNISLSSSTNAYSFSWVPKTLTGDCGTGSVNLTLAGGATCLAQNVTQDLNNLVEADALPFSQDPYSWDPATGTFTAFRLLMGGLTAGTYSLAIVAQTATLVTVERVPEPATLLLFGSGLAGLTGAAALRRRKKK